MSIEYFDGKGWRKENNFNAVWFVKYKFDLREEQTYEKIDYEMDLDILTSLINGSYIFESEATEFKNKEVEMKTILDLRDSQNESSQHSLTDNHSVEKKSESLITKFLRENISDDNVSQTNVERPKIKGLD